jgi:ATP-dependent DNA ligase
MTLGNMRENGAESTASTDRWWHCKQYTAPPTKPMLTLINPVWRAEPFDHSDWVFEAKFDGFRAAADTLRGRLISRSSNRMKRFEQVLDLLPKGYVFDGELVALDRRWAPAEHRAPATSARYSLISYQPKETSTKHG